MIPTVYVTPRKQCCLYCPSDELLTVHNPDNKTISGKHKTSKGRGGGALLDLIQRQRTISPSLALINTLTRLLKREDREAHSKSGVIERNLNSQRRTHLLTYLERKR